MFHFRYVVSTVVILILLSCAGHAQDAKKVYNHQTFWHKTEFAQFFNQNWGVGADLVIRRKDTFEGGSMISNPLRESIRPWLHYQFTSTKRLSLSPIGMFSSSPYIGQPEDFNRRESFELRTTIQYFNHNKYLNGRMINTWRYRYEFRYIRPDGSPDFNYQGRFRVRYRTRYVFNSDDFYDNGIIYTAISSELGINLGKRIVYNPFNQHRIYVGLGYRFFDTMRLEVRYVDFFTQRGAPGYIYDQAKGIMVGFYIDQLYRTLKQRVTPVRYYD